MVRDISYHDSARMGFCTKLPFSAGPAY